MFGEIKMKTEQEVKEKEVIEEEVIQVASPEAGNTKSTQVEMIPLEKLHPHKIFYKGIRNQERFDSLVDDIKKIGINQPLVVRPDNGGYEIGIGHHRCEAAKILEMKKVPAIVKYVEADSEWDERCVWDNLMRIDYSPVQKEEQIHLLFDKGKETGRYKNYSDMARKSKYSDVWIGNLDKGYYYRQRIKDECEVILDDTISTQNIIDATALLKDRKDEKRALNGMAQLLKLVMENEYKSGQIKEMAKTLRDWDKKYREQVLYEYKNYRYGTIKNEIMKQVNTSIPKPKKEIIVKESTVNKNLVIETYNAIEKFGTFLQNLESKSEKEITIRYVKVTLKSLCEVLLKEKVITERQYKQISEDILGVLISPHNYDGGSDLQRLKKFLGDDASKNDSAKVEENHSPSPSK